MKKLLFGALALALVLTGKAYCYEQEQEIPLELTTKYEYSFDKDNKGLSNTSCLKERITFTGFDLADPYIEISLNKSEGESGGIKLETDTDIGIGAGIKADVYTIKTDNWLDESVFSVQTQVSFLKTDFDEVILNGVVQNPTTNDVEAFSWETTVTLRKGYIFGEKLVVPYVGLRYEHTYVKTELNTGGVVINNTDREDMLIPLVGVEVDWNGDTTLLAEAEYYDNEFTFLSGITLKF